MLIDKTIYAKERVTHFTSDTMLGSVKKDRRTGEAKVLLQGPPKCNEIAIRGLIKYLGTPLVLSDQCAI